MIDPSDDTETCIGCNSVIPRAGYLAGPANGWLMPWKRFGYYGGFTDDVGDDEWVFVCHRCVLRVLHVLPGLASKIGPGSHFSLSGEKCCDFSLPWG